MWINDRGGRENGMGLGEGGYFVVNLFWGNGMTRWGIECLDHGGLCRG